MYSRFARTMKKCPPSSSFVNTYVHAFDDPQESSQEIYTYYFTILWQQLLMFWVISHKIPLLMCLELHTNSIYLRFNQKQSSRGVLRIRCSENMKQIQTRTPLLKFIETLLTLHFGMGVLLQICCIFSEHLILRTTLEGCFCLNQFHLRKCLKKGTSLTSKLNLRTTLLYVTLK